MEFSGAIVQANLFGELAGIVYLLYESQIELQSKVDKINGAFKNLGLEGKIADESLAFVRNSHHVQKQIEELNDFMSRIPPSLSNEIVARLVETIMKDADFLNLKIGNTGGGNERIYRIESIRLSQLLMLCEICGGHKVFTEGDECTGLYVLMNGSIMGYILDSGMQISIDLTQASGSVFGEISYFLNTKRTASIYSETTCSFLFLKTEYRKLFFQGSPLIYKFLRE